MTLLGKLVTTTLVALLSLWLFEQLNVFQPSNEIVSDGSEFGETPETVQLLTEDQVPLHGWFYPGTSQPESPAFAVLIAHGNGGNLTHRLGLYQCWRKLGVAVLAFDYRGYGLSGGFPSENGTYLDAEAAHAWLTRRGFPPQRILAHGESLGGAVATELALRQPLAGLVLQSTFTRITDVGAERFPILPVRTLARFRYNTVEKLPRLRVPILFLHSRTDSLIGFHHAQTNFSAAAEPKWLREIRGDHNDQPEADPAGFCEALQTILTHLQQ
jgi:fermentation-respiration switch protein FrsA (DUF1100 family)